MAPPTKRKLACIKNLSSWTSKKKKKTSNNSEDEANNSDKENVRAI
jgi:hypothetical protein